ncbi:lysosome membrane protein 2-like [Clavelina lepadiformis]|uniref:lysosome membrane protein 2-like n=1 Tax=Clavelina lepadiformis TaxID=159417 RepID=UPI004042D146
MAQCCLVTSISIGVLLIVGGAILAGIDVGSKIVDEELQKQLVLSLDSPVFSQWMNPPPPIYMQYWLFNVTNPEVVVSGGKPKVEQIGPFTYRLYQPRIDVAFFTNDTVSYKYNHTLVFEREMSVHDDDLVITQLNAPLVTIDSLLKSVPSWAASVAAEISVALSDSDLFVKHTVHEFLFGYEDPIFKLVHTFLHVLHIDFPPRFGFFYGFNNSDDGTYLVNTGRSDISQTNILHKFNGNKSLSYWTSEAANMINGTDGVFMPPKINRSETLYIFNTDVCRSLYLVFEKDTKVRNVDTMRFHLPGDVFANVTTNPANAGFCVPADECLDTGVLNIGPCKQGAPVVVSSPHFYLGAKKYIDAVDGISPNKEEHSTYLDLEPMTGVVFAAMKRLQLNIHLQSSKTFSQMENLNDLIFPVLWLNESEVIDKNSANQFKSKVVVLVRFAHGLPYIILGVGLLVALVTSGLIARKKYKTKSSDAIEYDNLNKEDSSEN